MRGRLKWQHGTTPGPLTGSPATEAVSALLGAGESNRLPGEAWFLSPYLLMTSD